MSFSANQYHHINDEPFRVLCSNVASRPNTPVNVCIGPLIIKEIFHTTTYEEQAPV